MVVDSDTDEVNAGKSDTNQTKIEPDRRLEKLKQTTQIKWICVDVGGEGGEGREG